MKVDNPQIQTPRKVQSILGSQSPGLVPNKPHVQLCSSDSNSTKINTYWVLQFRLLIFTNNKHVTTSFDKPAGDKKCPKQNRYQRIPS